MNGELDIRDVLPNISQPTLVTHRTDERWIKVGGGPRRTPWVSGDPVVAEVVTTDARRPDIYGFAWPQPFIYGALKQMAALPATSQTPVSTWMKAIVQDRYGDPVLRHEAGQPRVGAGTKNVDMVLSLGPIDLARHRICVVADRPIGLTMREHARGANWGPEVARMSGLEMLRASLERRLPDAPVTKLTGLRLSEAGLGLASASMPASPWWQSGAGVFLAGTTAFVSDMPLGCAVLTGAAPGWGITTSELSVNFLRSPTIRCQTIIGRAHLIHATRSLGLSEATIEDGRGRLLGHATSRCVLFRLDPEVMTSTGNGDAHQGSGPDPYLRAVEGDVRGQEFWDSTSGPEVMQQTVAGDFTPPCWLLIGLRAVNTSEGKMTMAMSASRWLCNAFGVIYGGAIAFLADATIILAAGSTVEAGTAYNTIDLKVNFLRPVLPDGELTAQASVIHRGRTIAVVNCEIRDLQGKLVATATGSVLILPGRHWEKPVQVADEITPEASRVLTTVLFIDIVDSTHKAAALGDRRWRDALADYQSVVRQEVQRYYGSEVDSVGDGFLVAFDSAARAVRCAAAARNAVRSVGLEIRVGVHTGECERSGGKLVGIAVHTGSRIEALAAPGEILVSSLVKELVAGSGIAFEDRGEHELKGVPGAWRLFAATP